MNSTSEKGLMKKRKPKEYIVTYKYVDCPDAEERMQRIAELLLKANANRLKKCRQNGSLRK